jgi:hypothetical protein
MAMKQRMSQGYETLIFIKFLNEQLGTVYR